MSTENEYTPTMKANELYPYNGTDPDIVMALRSSFRAGAEWQQERNADVAAKALEEAAAGINCDFQNLPSWTASYKAGERTPDWESGGARMVVDTMNWLNARAAALRASTGGEDA